MQEDKQLLITIFKDEAAAEAAASALTEWAPLLDITLKAMGILVVDEEGRLKTDKIGKTSGGKGAGIGIVLAMATPIGLAAGVIGGGLLGKLHHKGLGLSNEDRERLGTELLGGKAALGVISDPTGCEAIAAKLEGMGGTPQVHPLPDEAVEEIDAAADAEPLDPVTINQLEARPY